MGTNVWQLLLVIFIFVIWSFPMLAIYFDRSNETVGRVIFVGWFITLLLLGFGSQFLISTIGIRTGNISVPTAFVVIVGIVLIWMFAKRISWRTRDAGLKRWIAYLAASPLPLVNIAIIVFLCFARPKNFANKQ